MADLEKRILAAVAQPGYQPLKAKALARKLELPGSSYQAFKDALRGLLKQGRLELGKNKSIRPSRPHGSVIGVFRRATAGFGFVRPHLLDGKQAPEIFVPEEHVGDGTVLSDTDQHGVIFAGQIDRFPAGSACG